MTARKYAQGTNVSIRQSLALDAGKDRTVVRRWLAGVDQEEQER